MWCLGQHDHGFGVVAQIVQRGDQRPAVHLGLVDLLCAVIQPGGVAQANSVGGGEQAEVWVRRDDLVLIQQRQLAVMLQYALDHKHHIGAASIIFVKHNRNRVAQRPRQDAFVEFRDLLAVFQLDRVFTNQVNPGDVAVQVHPHRRPVQPRRNLLDVGRFACAVITLDHYPAIVREPSQNRHRGVRIELVGGIDRRHPLGPFGKAFGGHVGVNSEHIADRDTFGGFSIDIQQAVAHDAILILIPPSAGLRLRDWCNILPARARGTGRRSHLTRCLNSNWTYQRRVAAKRIFYDPRLAIPHADLSLGKALFGTGPNSRLCRSICVMFFGGCISETVEYSGRRNCQLQL